jgi:GNAT superfamily N-acetyltransferase
VIATATPTTPATLVCSIGYQGQPAGERVEVGYSVVEAWRRRGIATEAVSALVERARQYGMRAVIAHALPHNAASIAVLTRSRFRPATSTRPGELGFERLLYAVRRARPEELGEVNSIYSAIDFKPSHPGDLQLVADSGGSLVGLGRLVPVTSAASAASAASALVELGGIWVADHFRGDGTARALVSALLDAAPPQPLACLPFSRLELFYASFGFAPWDPKDAPPALQDKLAFCERTYAEPVSLMRRPAKAR